MRGFVYSFGAMIAIFVIGKIPIVSGIVFGLGFFFAIIISILAQLIAFLPSFQRNEILIFGPPILAVVLHFILPRANGKMFRDSVFTIFAALWFSFAVSTMHILCEMQHGGSSSAEKMCSGWVPDL